MADISDVVLCKIHPAIGISRVGNSPTDFFVGPEIPGMTDPPQGGYKDLGDPVNLIAPRVKRQAARFRIFGYDRSGNCLGEIQSSEASGTEGLRAAFTWTAHLANKKGAFHKFRGRAGEDAKHPSAPLRNKDIQGEDRKKLVIDPGPRDISGVSAHREFTSGTFLRQEVPLGELRTDENGNLLVLGGFGKSGTVDPSIRITNYANNDRWFDDISDGPVSAQVRDGSRDIPVVGSWVLVAPPDFAPQISHITTLYDICFEVAVNKGLIAPAERPSFTKQIYPILSRVCALQWVNKLALSGHGPGSGDQTRPGFDLIKYLPQLADNGEANKELRQQVFTHLRNPNAAVDGETAMNQANLKFMPPLSGDSGDALTWTSDYAPDDPFIPETWLTITKLQYATMQKWAEGEFDSDWGSPSEAAGITAEGLDKAALEATVGGAFYPGIEAGWVMRNPSNYMDKEAFRLDHAKLSAGDVSQHMACPWQADFYECNTDWWPAQRPDDVLTEEALEAITSLDAEIAALDKDDAAYQDNLRHLNTRKFATWFNRDRWTRGFPDNDYSNDAYSHAGDETMVDDWHHLGFVVNQLPDGSTPTMNGQPQFIETERYKYVTDMAESFHCLLNLEEFPDFVPRAKELALQFLADAKFNADPSYSEFTYSEEAFRARLDKIYNDFVDETMNEPLWTETGNITWTAVVDYDSDGEPIRAPRHYNVGSFSNRAIKERILQAAPFNLIVSV